MSDDSLQFKTVIVRLSPFRDVVKSVTHQFLYGECRKVLADEQIDFAFFPAENDRKHSSEIRSMRSNRPLTDFDLLFISNSFTTELLNLPYLLHHANIPCRCSERAKSQTKPLVIMGGSNALASQSILYNENDAMADALFFGEGEDMMSRIIAQLKSVPQSERRAKLKSLEGIIPGLKVFGFEPQHTTIQKALYRGTTEQLANAEQYLFDSSEALTARLFIAYGCPSFCTFCFEGWERKPYREIPLNQLIAAADNLKKKTGADTLEITAFNFNTHTDVTSLFTELSKRFFQVNFMSQRADILAANPTLAHYEVAAGKRQFTLGVEGISERMRSYFNKNLNEQTALAAITLLLKEPIREIKLFYIISGLETAEDCADYTQFLSKVASLRELYNSGIRILCSFGLLVRMPFTPLRYEKLLLTEEEWKSSVSMIHEATEAAGHEFRLTYDYEEFFLSQTLALTKVHCASVLEEMAEKGYVYDMGIKSGAWNFFKEHVPVTPDFCAEKDESYTFAFSDVDVHTNAQFLYKKFRDAKNGAETPLCMGNACAGCNSCDSDQRAKLASHTITMPTLSDCEEIASIVKAKAQAKPVYISFYIPENMKLSRSETRAAYVMRTLLDAIPSGTTRIMTVRDTLFGGKDFEEKMTRWYGRTIYAVYPFSNEQTRELSRSIRRAASDMLSDEHQKENQILRQLSEITVFDSQPVTDEVTAVIAPENDNALPEELEKAAAATLDSMHVQFTLSRKNGVSSFTIAPKSLKKHIVSSCYITNNRIVITGCQKLDMSTLKNWTAGDGVAKHRIFFTSCMDFKTPDNGSSAS